MPSYPLYIINAFPPPPFPPPLNTGNPAAIVPLTAAQNASLTDAARQSLAYELNLSETAFVTPCNGSTKAFQLRWFTPKAEVDLCGHATLAAAAALMEHGWTRRGTSIDFKTKSGTLGVEIAENGRMKMFFPALEAVELRDSDTETQLLQGLGLEKKDVERVLRSKHDAVVIVRNGASVRGVVAEMEVLKGVESFRGVIVAAREGEGFVSRFFAPKVGVDEDPVTGSAHCVLATLFVGMGEEVFCRQVSERGGGVWVGRPRDGVVSLSGEVRVVVRGEVDV